MVNEKEALWRLPSKDEEDLRTLDGKQVIIDEYWEWRGKSMPEVIKAIRKQQENSDEACPWCADFKKNEIGICLNCGARLLGTT